jgi:hypothetical protein
MFLCLLDQCEELYLKPRNIKTDTMVLRFPGRLSILLGHSLRRQIDFVQANPSLRPSFNFLQGDMMTYIAEVSKATHYRKKDGRPPSGDDLWQLAADAIRGRYDNYVLKNYRVNARANRPIFNARLPDHKRPRPGEPPRIGLIWAVSGRTLETGPSQHEDFTDEGDQVNLLGQTPSDKPNSAKAYYNTGVKYWNKGLPDKAKWYWERACKLGWESGCHYAAMPPPEGSKMKYWGNP